MLKLLSRITAVIAMLSLLAVPVLIPAVASAQTPPATPPATATPDISGQLCSGANLKVDATSGCTATTTGSTVNNLIATVINILSLVVGVVAVVMIIIGGLKYITSGGDSGNVSGAKNTILYAVIGLVFVALAQIIVRFVLGRTAPTLS